MSLSFWRPDTEDHDLNQEELLSIARHERDALGRTVQYTPPDHWDVESRFESWRIRDVLAHLAASEVAVAALVGGEEPTELDEYRKSLGGETATTSGWNRWAVDRRREDGPVYVGLEWGRAADLLLQRAGAASEEEWSDNQIEWISGEVRLKYVVQSRVAEWWVHGEDIREGGRLPPRREHWPVYATCDLAIRLLPYSLSRRGHDVGDATVEFDLDGVGGGRWHQSTSTRDAVAEGKPDVYVESSGYALASVAAGRAGVDVMLYEGLLRLGGNTELGETVVRSLRSTL